MTLLLVILSVLALWTLLSLLVVGLLLVLKSLEGVRLHLRKISMGVRAIETETAPLQRHARALGPTLVETRRNLQRAADSFDSLTTEKRRRE